MVNKYIAIGNLTHDPNSKGFDSGKTVCNFSIAISGVTGDPFFIEIQTWDKNADKCQKYLKRGSKVYVEGRLRANKWTSKTGEKRSKLYCTADVVHFLGGNNPEGANNNNESEIKTDEQPEITDDELEDIPF